MPRLVRAVAALVLASFAGGATVAAAADRYVYTVAGTGSFSNGGDGGPATAAPVLAPCVASLDDGGFLIAGAARVRHVDARGIISTVAGVGPAGYSGDGGPATAARIAGCGLSPLATGGFLLADGRNRRVRRVAADGTISTVAGNGVNTTSGDGGPAVAGSLTYVSSVAAFPAGGFLARTVGRSDLLRRVDADGRLATVAGLLDERCRDVAGRDATELQLHPIALAATQDGGLLIGDNSDCVLRMAADGSITRVAGSGDQTPNGGDGGPAREASMSLPRAIAPTADGGFLLVDYHTIRKVDASGTIQRVAGCLDTTCPAGDGAALGVSINPIAVAAAPDGTIYIGEADRIDRIDPHGSLTTLASGEGDALSVASDGAVLAVGSNLVRRIAPDGSSATVAGGGTKPPAVGLPATDVSLPSQPSVAALPDGGFALFGGQTISIVSSSGTITRTSDADSFPRYLPSAAIAARPDGELVYTRDEGDNGQVMALGPDQAPSIVAGGPLPLAVGQRATQIDLFRSSIAALPDGGFAIASSSDADTPALTLADADGRIAQVTPLHKLEIETIVSDRSGRLFFAGSDCRHGCDDIIGRISPAGRVARLASEGFAGFWGSTNGDPASRVDFQEGVIEQIAPTADGGVLASVASRVYWIAPPRTKRLALAIARQSLPLLARRRIAVRSTVPASLTIVARRRGRVVGRAHAHVRRGLSRVSLPRRIGAGQYTVTVSGRSAGRVATDRHRLLVGGLLPTSTARRLAGGNIVLSCHRFGATRVDCLTSDEDCGSNFCDDDCGITAFDLRPDGVVWARPYEFKPTLCPKDPRRLPPFRFAPRWDRHAQQADPI